MNALHIYCINDFRHPAEVLIVGLTVLSIVGDGNILFPGFSLVILLPGLIVLLLIFNANEYFSRFDFPSFEPEK